MGCCLSSDVISNKRDEKQQHLAKMKIKGSHSEHHLKLNKKVEKASMVAVLATVKQLKEQYEIDRNVLGKGSFGEVYKAFDKRNPEFQVAIKVLKKNKMSHAELITIMDEVDLLKKVDHPNIV